MTNWSSCRFCQAPLTEPFLDLGMSPLSNAYLRAEQLNHGETFFPLKTFVCDSCFLVQLEAFVSPADIFSDYAYFSSYSESWLQHAETYSNRMACELALDANSLVVEVASNDGYLLQFFKAQQIPVLGIEPARNVAEVAQRKEIPTVVEFFGENLAHELSATRGKADLLLGNNVLAHVPDIRDFISGLRVLLKPRGIITMEFPHLLKLMEQNQFDTIYHEHFSYLSLNTTSRMFASQGLQIFDVEELPTHGGSLRIHACHDTDTGNVITSRFKSLLNAEQRAGLENLEGYSDFANRVAKTKFELLEFLIAAKKQGKTVAAYGAAAKGNTLLNYCGIGPEFIDYVVDRSPHKQGLFLPGSHIPIYPVEHIDVTRPDYLLILPWNLAEEICTDIARIRQWGGRFVISIPEVKVLP